MRAPADGQPPAASRLRHARWLYPLFWWLVVVWIVDPARPTPVYRTGVIATYAVLLVGYVLRTRWRLPTPARRTARWLDCATANAVALLLLGEVALRLLASQIDSPLLVAPDAGAAERIRHQRYRPHGLHAGRPCNALGFVDEEVAVARQPGVRRILALGDSFAVGIVPYAANFLTLLDDALDATAPTEVCNFGVTGIGPAEYLHLWRTEACRYEPDEVLLCFYLGNDFARRRTNSLLHRESLATVAAAMRAWQLLSHAPQAGDAPDLGVANLDLPTLSESEHLHYATEHARAFARTPDPETALAIEHTTDLLAQLAAAVGPRLRVVIIPDQLQLDDELWRRVTGDTPDAFDREAPRRLLLAFCGTRGTPCLDLLPALRTAAREGPVHAPRDIHWNARGNAAAAAALAGWLLGG